MFSVTYRYLDRGVRLSGLTLGQWLQLVAGAISAFAMSKLLALIPGLSATYALSIAVTLAGMPLAAAFVAMDADFDVTAYLRAAIKWRRGPKLLLAGPNPTSTYPGYRIVEQLDDTAQHAAPSNGSRLNPNEMEVLWDRS
ncbi:MAG: hypothetical protein JWQ48_2368 [Conexibacter sp.]|nr:hypothetical protein [Conexibacter sp.]